MNHEDLLLELGYVLTAAHRDEYNNQHIEATPILNQQAILRQREREATLHKAAVVLADECILSSDKCFKKSTLTPGDSWRSDLFGVPNSAIEAYRKAKAALAPETPAEKMERIVDDCSVLSSTTADALKRRLREGLDLQ